MDKEITRNILFTRSLTEDHRKYGQSQGLQICDKSFINIEVNELSQEQIDKIISVPKADWIFTSQNAVKCISKFLTQISSTDTICYAVGEKTAEALEEVGLKAIVPEYHNSRALVDLLETKTHESYIYFSGNLRQNILINFFQETEKSYEEIQCYQTQFIQPEVDIEKYDAICFCSPSAAKSFFNKYQVKETVPCVAIGNTTAVKLLDYTEHVVMAEKTNVYAMINMCNEYLNS